MRGVLDARAGRAGMASVKIVGHRETSRFVRTSRALTSAVAHFGSVRTLPRTRQVLTWAKPRSTGARTAASAVLDRFCPRVRGRLRAAFYPVITATEDRPGRAAEPHSRRPLPSVSAITTRADLLQVAAYQVGEIVQSDARQGHAGGAGKTVRVLNGTVGFLHTKLNCRRGPAGYVLLAAA